MNVSDLLSAISLVGFPIVACCAMGYFFVKIINNYRADIKEMNQSHKEEMAAITQAVNNNTLVMQKLVDRMDGDDK